MKIPRELFQIVFALHSRHPWLVSREVELLELMNECEHQDEQHLVANLLQNFFYLDADKHAASVERICKQIVEVWALDESKTQVLAATADSAPDSGQFVVYELRNAFANVGWGSVYARNRYDKAMKEAEKRRCVVLVDEFVGTGQTMAGRVRTLRAQFKSKQLTDTQIFVAAYAGMEFSIETIRKAGCDDVFYAHPLKRGISEISPPENIAADLKKMSRLEDKLVPSWNGKELPRLGYGECEALYAKPMGNIPNSVFPVFWWPASKDGTNRFPIFRRQENVSD